MRLYMFVTYLDLPDGQVVTRFYAAKMRRSRYDYPIARFDVSPRLHGTIYYAKLSTEGLPFFKVRSRRFPGSKPIVVGNASIHFILSRVIGDAKGPVK